MPLSALTGTRLRERASGAGLRQAEVAAAAGDFGQSYLQPDRTQPPQGHARGAGRGWPRRLGLTEAALAEGREAALIEDLRAAARGGVRQARARAEIDRLEEFVGRFPGWARLLADACTARVQGAGTRGRGAERPHDA